jgi:hypothetical protein
MKLKFRALENNLKQRQMLNLVIEEKLKKINSFDQIF